MSTDTGGTTATTTADPASTSATTTSPAAQTTQSSDPKASTTQADPNASTTTTTTDDAPWQDKLPKALAEDPLFRGYKSVDDLAQAHQHLTKLKGATAAELLKIPSKPQDQAPEDWAPIHKALGVPEDPKDYAIALAPEAAADTPELEGILRELGGKAKFQPAQMAAVIDTLNGLGQKAAEAEKAELVALSEEVTTTLKKEQGAAYDGNVRAIGKLIREGIDASLGHIKDPAAKAAAAEEAAAELETKLGSNLTLARILAHAVGKMAEPEAPGGGNAGGDTRQLTPAAAKAALNAFYADREKMTALNTKGHPQHAAVLAERAALLTQQRGEKRPDAVS